MRITVAFAMPHITLYCYTKDKHLKDSVPVEETSKRKAIVLHFKATAILDLLPLEYL
jgi:hypothetical protein